MSSAQTGLSMERMVFRKTNQHKGRRISVTPENSTNKHLSYGRIILDASVPIVSFDNGNQETGLICLSGQAAIRVGQNVLISANTIPSTFHAIAILKSALISSWILPSSRATLNSSTLSNSCPMRRFQRIHH